MRKNKRKLTLSGEVLRVLTDAETTQAVGAYASGRSCDFGNCTTERNCGTTYNTCACVTNNNTTCLPSCIGC
jgi:hypothetical protein